MNILKAALLTATLAATMMATGSALAAYPDKTVKLVVTFAPGGFADNLARLVAERMSKSLGQTVIVENRAGANGMLGAESVARSAPDGYTLMLAGVDTMVINPAIRDKVPYDPEKDFEQVGMVVSLPMILAASMASPDKIQSFPDLIAKAKAKGAKERISYGTWGDGSSGHLAMEMINVPASLSMLHVPYKGTGPALNDVIAGFCELTLVGYQTGEQYFKANRLRALAVTSRKRLPVLPQVPTIAEMGFPDYDVGLWYSIAAPRGTPAEVVNKLNGALREVLDDTGFKARMAVSGAPIVGGSPADARKFIDKDKVRWQTVAKSIRIEQK